MKDYIFRNQDEIDWFEERAAIIEFDGLIAREYAENMAFEEILRKRNCLE